jgi:transcriptional regulator of arginine metabolism
MLAHLYNVLIYVDAYNYSMSKLSRQAVIRELIDEREIASQDELRRLLFRRGHRVTQATLSRDMHELALMKTPEGYKLPQGEESELSLPSIERLIETFVYDVKTALNQVVIKTSPGSAQPVSAAIDAEEWEEVVGTIGGDDTILAIATDSRSAEKLAQRLRKYFA